MAHEFVKKTLTILKRNIIRTLHTVRVRLLLPPKSWERYRFITKRYISSGLHGNYENWVKRFDPSVSFPRLEGAELAVSSGGGLGNLNVFRNAKIDGVDVFEKIYHTQSEDLQRLLRFHQDILPGLNGRIKTPLIRAACHGQKLTLICFERIVIQPIAPSKLMEFVFDFQCAAKLIRNEEIFGYGKTDFRDNDLYRHCLILLKRRIGDMVPADTVEILERFMAGDSCRKCFTHADLTCGNVMSDQTILDWDQCGLYPEGYEVGRALGSELIDGFDDAVEIEHRVRERLPDICTLSMAGYLYFTAVFRARSIDRRHDWDECMLPALVIRAAELAGSDDNM